MATTASGYGLGGETYSVAPDTATAEIPQTEVGTYTFAVPVDKVIVSVRDVSNVELLIAFNQTASASVWDVAAANKDVPSPDGVKVTTVSIYGLGSQTVTYQTHFNVRGFRTR